MDIYTHNKLGDLITHPLSNLTDLVIPLLKLVHGYIIASYVKQYVSFLIHTLFF